jgi:hypothetical protein
MGDLTRSVNIDKDMWFTVDVERSGVKIRFMWLNPRPHSAVLTGKVGMTPYHATLTHVSC